MCYLGHYIDILNCPSEETVWASLHTLKNYLYHCSWATALHKIQDPDSSVKFWGIMWSSEGQEISQQSHIN